MEDAVIIFLSIAGIRTDNGLMEEPVCLILCVALFNALAFVFLPSPPTQPTYISSSMINNHHCCL